VVDIPSFKVVLWQGGSATGKQSSAPLEGANALLLILENLCRPLLKNYLIQKIHTEYFLAYGMRIVLQWFLFTQSVMYDSLLFLLFPSSAHVQATFRRPPVK